jgi:hypothetical protein
MSLTYNKKEKSRTPSSTNPTWVRIGYDSPDTMSASLLFEDVPIPRSAVIESAYLKLTSLACPYSSSLCSQSPYNNYGNIVLKIYGIDTGNATTRLTTPLTTANVNWNISPVNYLTEYTSSDIKTVIQEIVDRADWNGGNSLNLYVQGQVSSPSDAYFYTKEGRDDSAPVLIITFAGTSQTATTKLQARACVQKQGGEYGLKITKPTFNVLTETNPGNFIFNSSLPTLKYHISGELERECLPETTFSYFYIPHNMGYFPFVEVYVEVYTTTPTGVYQYCPASGITTGLVTNREWQIQIMTTITRLYINVIIDQGNDYFDGSVYFNFKYFILKNKINFPL